jgi:hypothetical protein
MVMSAVPFNWVSTWRDSSFKGESYDGAALDHIDPDKRSRGVSDLDVENRNDGVLQD